MTQNGRSGVVNALTFVRVPLIFAWAALAISCELAAKPGSALGVALASFACVAMFLSGVTDLLDGHLARKWGVVSTLGKMADPLMDKMFFFVAFPVLLWQALRQDPNGAHGLVLLFFNVIYMLRDTWVTFMRSVGSLYGADVAAMWLGKVRTAMSFPAAGWIYLYLSFRSLVPSSLDRPWLMSCIAIEVFLALLTVWSAYTYTVAYWPYLRKAMSR